MGGDQTEQTNPLPLYKHQHLQKTAFPQPGFQQKTKSPAPSNTAMGSDTLEASTLPLFRYSIGLVVGCLVE